MHRVALLDGLRGYFLLFMVLHHLPFPDGLALARLHHGSLSYVQDAQGFIFLSGLVLGLRAQRATRRAEADRFRRLCRRRAALLYGCTIGLSLFLFACVGLWPWLGEAWAAFLPDLQAAFGAHVAGTLLLLYLPSFADILPQYVLYLLATPWLVRHLSAGRQAEVLGGSLLLWLLAQFGWHLPLAELVQSGLDAHFAGTYLRGHFNPFAWQILFVLGLAVGHGWADDATRERLRRLLGNPTPVRLGLAVCLLFVAYRAAFAFESIDPMLADRFFRLSDRTEFGLAYLLNFAALAWVTAALLLHGERTRIAPLRLAAMLLRALLSARPLELLGRHSLLIYALHVPLIYAVAAIQMRAGGLAVWLEWLLALAVIGALLLTALLRHAATLAPRSPRAPA